MKQENIVLKELFNFEIEAYTCNMEANFYNASI